MVPGLPVSQAGPTAARLEGLVLGIDGRPAEGHRVHLIDPQGVEVATAATDARGFYAFDGVGSGRYGMAVGDPDGELAPVTGPPVVLAEGQRARRDLELVTPDAPGRHGPAGVDPSVRSWWTGLSTPAKAWVVVASVVAAWFLYEALENDAQEEPASPM
jgi:hypothetical protein